VLVAVGLVALLGVVALSVDVGRIVVAKQQLQNVADAAALAGASVLRNGMDAAAARQAAIAVASQNAVLGEAASLDPQLDVTVGVYNSATGAIEPWTVSESGVVSVPTGTVAIRVAVRRTPDSPGGAVPMTFARILGLDEVNVSASAIAGLAVQMRARAPVEMMITQDYSGSFGNEFTSARDANLAFVNVIQPVAVAGDSPGMGDKIGYVGFADYVIDSSHHPTTGFTDSVYGSWSQSNVSRNYPLALTRMDIASGGYTTVRNKFTGTNQVFHFMVGSDTSRKRNPNLGPCPGGLMYSSSTNTAAGLRAAAAKFKNTSGQWLNPNAEHVVVLVSDGMAFFHNESTGIKNATASKAATVVAADELGAAGIVLHTVTLCQDSGATSYGFSGSDAEFNASLVRNGGYAFRTADAAKLRDLMISVGTIEVGESSLLK